MKISWPKIAILILCIGAIGFELWHFRSGSAPPERSSGASVRRKAPDFALLPAGEIELWNKYFAPASHATSWEPTLGDMNDVEADLAQITALSRTEGDPNRQIDNPQEYYRQYLAVEINGKKMLVLNAICSVDPDTDWRKHLVVVRDGGKCFWHAMYDLSTRKFSDLFVNGRA